MSIQLQLFYKMIMIMKTGYIHILIDEQACTTGLSYIFFILKINHIKLNIHFLIKINKYYWINIKSDSYLP